MSPSAIISASRFATFGQNASLDRLALLDVDASGSVDRVSFGDLRARSNRLADLIMKSGITPGERIAILLPQSREVAESHIAIYKTGAVALPLAVLFGVDALSLSAA